MANNDYMNYKEIEKEQISICNEQKCKYFPTDFNSKVGIALQTLNNIPINGLRYPPTEDINGTGATNGWFIWCGEEFSEDPDFFVPLHGYHLIDKCPGILKFLGLPPGYRFLLAGDYIDIWYDPSLLD